MERFEVVLTNAHGLHARPAGMLVQTSGKFKSDINILKGEIKANAKSLLSMMKLAASKGDHLTVEINGEDADDAAKALKALFDSSFGE